MTPRDILTSAATLTGLVLTAIGLSATITSLSTILQTLSLALILIVVLFVSAACLTCLASLTDNYGIFRATLVVYLAGWIFTGIFLCLFLLGNTWGIQILQIQIPSIPRLDVQTLLSLIFFLIPPVVVLYIYRRTRIDLKELETIIQRLDADQKRADSIAERALAESSGDRLRAFLDLSVRLEVTLRQMVGNALPYKDSHRMTMKQLCEVLYVQGRFNNRIPEAIGYVARTRNLIVHGGKISDEQAAYALDLVAHLLEELSDLGFSDSARKP